MKMFFCILDHKAKDKIRFNKLSLIFTLVHSPSGKSGNPGMSSDLCCSFHFVHQDHNKTAKYWLVHWEVMLSGREAFVFSFSFNLGRLEILDTKTNTTKVCTPNLDSKLKALLSSGNVIRQMIQYNFHQETVKNFDFLSRHPTVKDPLFSVWATKTRTLAVGSHKLPMAMMKMMRRIKVVRLSCKMS